MKLYPSNSPCCPQAPGNHESASVSSVSLLQVPHSSGTMRYLSSWDWLILLSTKSSNFVHAVAVSEIPSLLRLSNAALCASPTLCPHSSVDGHPGFPRAASAERAINMAGFLFPVGSLSLALYTTSTGGHPVPGLLKKRHAASQGSVLLHSHQQCMRAPVPPLPRQQYFS